MKDLVTVVAIVGLALVGFFAVTQDKVVVQDSDPLSGFAGPEVNSEFLKFNGIEKWYRAQENLTQNALVVCSFRAPLHSTSTLTGAVLKVGTSTNYTYDIAKATTGTATTTIIRSAAVTTDGVVTLAGASTTVSAQTLTDTVFAPGEYLNFALQGATAFRADGSCSAEFTVGGD